MKKICAAVLFFSQIVISQNKEGDTIKTKKNITKEFFKDSIKASFINHNTSNCIDERWLKELTNDELFEDLYNDIAECEIDSLVNYDLSSDVLKNRLNSLNSKSPFLIEYNPILENVIKSFLKRRSKSFERLMAISEYYFPMFEEYLAKYDVPLEIKYLAIVESALNPKARSRVGATGLWQFMYPTGKQFNLEVNSYVDERYDPIKATEAACQYLSSLYGIFGDWSLVLASYNAGPGNVSKAIRRSGGSQNYWNIRKNLPRETANYVPAFLATMYIYEFHKEHSIIPQKAHLTYFETDTIAVKRRISFETISELMEIPLEEIEFLNPIYKLNVVPFQEDKVHYLRLPKSKIGLFVSNEEKIYAYVEFIENLIEKTDSRILNQQSAVASLTKYHKIKSGESLSVIANKYGVSVSDLKKWNKIKGNNIRAGRSLKIFTKEKYTTSTSKSTNKNTGNQIYMVKKGDSLYSIAKKFPGISAEDIKKWNDIRGNTIKPGMKLNING